MKAHFAFKTFIIVAALLAGALNLVHAQAPPAPLPADPWPRQIPLTGATGLIYQPQVDAWDGNQIQIHAAASVKPAGGGAQAFGSIAATARTEVDRLARTVIFHDLLITKSNFPSLPDKGAAYVAQLQASLAARSQTISLNRVEASLKAAGVNAPSFPIKNDAPRIIFSNSPAILVPIDGVPVIKPVPENSSFRRIINTRALIMQSAAGPEFYLHVYDGWLSSTSLDGPWKKVRSAPPGMDGLGQKLAARGTVDLLDGGPKANPKPSLGNGVPTMYVSQVPAELIVFKGQPDFIPVVGTLLWANNTNADVLIDSASNNYYVLISGRWFRAPELSGPWSFVAGNALPPDFSRIPPNTPAAIVLASVAGTSQAQEAVIANSIPQTATVPLIGGPTFVPNFDGAPQYETIEGTALSYAANASVPIIRVDANNYYAVQSGVWFAAPGVDSPWAVATTVPLVIYTIPVTSPLHYVTYVRIYSATPKVVYVGYTPGYMGTVVGPYGTVVYGTGYVYSPWVGSVWYPPPYTYGIAAVPVYNAAVGFSYGFGVGLATSVWTTPYYGSAYHPYLCCGSVSANVYGQYGSVSSAGTKTAYAGGGQTGVSTSGTYSNSSTGASGNYSTNRNYDANTGVASESASRTGTNAAGGTSSGSATRSYNTQTGVASESAQGSRTTAAGGSASGSAGRSYNTQTGQNTVASSGSATGAGGSSVEHTGTTSYGPQGYSHTGSTTTTNAHTGQSHSWGSSPPSGSRGGGRR